MHSSRMRTGRSLTVCPGGGASFSGVLLSREGGVPPCREGGASFPGGASFLGGGASFLGGVPPSRGASFKGGGIPACTEADPPVNRITHTSKIITLATTSLPPVMIKSAADQN